MRKTDRIVTAIKKAGFQIRDYPCLGRKFLKAAWNRTKNCWSWSEQSRKVIHLLITNKQIALHGNVECFFISSCEGAPLMRQFADHALFAGTYAQSANCCMAELLRIMLFFVNSLENLRKIR